MKSVGVRLTCASLALVCGTGVSSPAATLHGRVKDRHCSVLSQVSVRIRSAQPGPEHALTTDDAGNYTLDLPAGAYHVCVQRGPHTAPICTDVDVAPKGDLWITTQLRDAVPDLSNLGNRFY